MRTVIGDDRLIVVIAHPDGTAGAVCTPPEKAWFLTRSFSFKKPMSVKFFVILFQRGAAGLALLSLAAPTARAVEAPLNISVLLAADMGYGDHHCLERVRIRAGQR